MLQFLLLVIVIVAIIAIVLAKRGARNPARQSDMPSCGNCGYATRGITELRCPECDADLRVVGIVRPGEGGSAVAGCLLPLLLTVMVYLVAGLGYGLATMIVPTYRTQGTSFGLWPASEEYAEVQIDTNLIAVIPAGVSRWGFSMSTSHSPAPVTDINFAEPGSTIKVKNISMQVTPRTSTTGTVTYAPSFVVDPDTKIASWSDASGASHVSKGPVTSADILAYLGTSGADTSHPDVIAEAQQLHDLIDGMLSGTSQFTLKGFDSGGYGSGGSGHIGPASFSPAYVLTWFVIWIIVLIVLARRGRERA